MTIAWNVRRALPMDVKAIRAIEQACTEAPHWSEAVWGEVLAEDVGGNLERVSFVAEANEGVVGFVVVSFACGVSELESVIVGESARRHGVARALCSAAMVWARGRKAQVIQLEVRASSAGALALYGLLGFSEQGKRHGYYRDPIDDAILMSTTLWNHAPHSIPRAVTHQNERVAKV